MAGPVGQFVKAGAVVVDLVEEGDLGRHRHVVGGWSIIGLVPADAQVHAGRGNERFGNGHDLALGQRRGVAGQTGLQTLALRDIENGEALEERYGPRVLVLARRAFRLAFGNETIGVDHCDPALALADAASRRNGLPESQPALRGMAVRDAGRPQ